MRGGPRPAAAGARRGRAVANLHRLFCSIREMSVVLGQRKLADAASRGVGALDTAQGGGPGQ